MTGAIGWQAAAATADADVLIIGAGPAGLAAAIAVQNAGLRALVVDGSMVVSAIAQYPTYVRFFSTADKLALGGMPFVVAADKPSRRDAMAYYRAVVQHFGISVRQYETVRSIQGALGAFRVNTRTRGGEDRVITAGAIVVATGYFGSPNKIGVPGEDLAHVTHVYREGHEAFQQDVVVVGGGNSAVEAALDLWRSGARVTLVHFGPTFDKRIKPWVGPDFENRVKEGSITARWNTRVSAIEPGVVHLVAIDAAPPTVSTANGSDVVPANLVYVMTGFAPNVALLRDVGVPIDAKTGIPDHNPETLETSVAGVFIAGVVVAGFDANKVFIENARYHGDRIVAHLMGQGPPAVPSLSAELDS